MTAIVGNAAAQAEFSAAVASGSLHHAWLIAGPEGIGKASFARAAAARLLGAAHGGEERAQSMIVAGSHPDYRALVRLPRESAKDDTDLARSISIAQVRSLQPIFANAPAFSSRRVVVIDAVDDLERPGASNALLKNLEEPPAGTIFLLVSHAPGRLLPTIRSRCRLLRFEALGEADLTSVLREQLPEADAGEIAALTAAGQGSPGRALRYAGLDLARLDRALTAIARDGDPTNAQRLALAKSLGTKSVQARYEAFLDRVPSLIAAAARDRTGPALREALDLHARATRLAAFARATSLIASDTVFEMASLVAGLARAF